jgi:glycosyltransferase involved in cell wall biosynthesis
MRGKATAKTVLVLSYVFPPAAYVGGHRTTKYCKYLSEYGWRPTVVTIDCKNVALKDEGLIRQLPDDVKVLRTRDIDPAKWLNGSSGLRSPVRTTPVGAFSSAEREHGRRWPWRWLVILRRVVRRVLLESPDSHVFWVPFAFFRAARVLITRRVDVIYSSSPPHSCHLAGSLLARCFRKPHVVDFRDPWFVKDSVRPHGMLPPPFPILQRLLKRAVVTGASRVIAVSSGERDELSSEFPSIDGRRFLYITNGYDPDDFKDLVPSGRDRSQFILTHTGTIYPGVADEFFAAVELVVGTHPELESKLRVNLLGGVDPSSNETAARLIRAGIIANHGFKPHATALQCAQASDVLVVLVGGDFFLPSHLPAKVFEYMRLGKPILAVTREGDLARLLAATGAGVVVPPKDPARLAGVIWDLYTRCQDGQLNLSPDCKVIEGFQRRSLAAALATALDEAARERESTPARRRPVGG